MSNNRCKQLHTNHHQTIMKKRKFVAAAGGIVTTLFIAGASQTFAQTISPSRSHTYVSGVSRPQDYDYDTSSRPDMADFGVEANDILTEEELELTSREILEQEGFTSAQIYKIFKTSAEQTKPTSTGLE
jgi:hypothetical protein